MPSILVTPPTIEPVTLVEAKAHLRVGHADEDALIGTLISAARRHVEARTGLFLIEQGWTCFRDDWPDDGVIELPLAPLLAVGELATFDEADVKTVIDPDHYLVDGTSRPPRLVLRGSRVWTRPERIANGIAVAVTAGFGPTETDVPEPLRQAILILVAHWFDHRGDGRPPSPPLTVETLVKQFREMRL
jgi:uncharacterized phiE125 gp8 family phage protein